MKEKQFPSPKPADIEPIVGSNRQNSGRGRRLRSIFCRTFPRTEMSEGDIWVLWWQFHEIRSSFLHFYIKKNSSLQSLPPKFHNNNNVTMLRSYIDTYRSLSVSCSCFVLFRFSASFTSKFQPMKVSESCYRSYRSWEDRYHFLLQSDVLAVESRILDGWIILANTELLLLRSVILCFVCLLQVSAAQSERLLLPQ